MTWTISDVDLPMEAVAFGINIRGVIRSPYPGQGPIQGYDFRLRFRRPPDKPGADTPMEHTPWMFLSAPEFEQLAAMMTQYMQSQGHLSESDTAPPGPPN